MCPRGCASSTQDEPERLIVMAHTFDPGYASEPFRSLCRSYPGPSVYPPADFRVEWGPIFHRGRLDGSARVLVLGQDPGPSENVARRILVGKAGHRVQGFLVKLGVTSSYVMLNAFLYSVYGQDGAERHRHDAAIAVYRERWFDALLVDTKVEAVVAFGSLADDAFRRWKATPAGQGVHLAYEHVKHPTSPRSTTGLQDMLAEWNAALQRLAPAIEHQDVSRDLVLYGDDFVRTDLAPIPERDLPPGLPSWMRSAEAWADRGDEADLELRRATLVVTVPPAARRWPG